jgi:hypothetical protein
LAKAADANQRFVRIGKTIDPHDTKVTALREQVRRYGANHVRDYDPDM